MPSACVYLDYAASAPLRVEALEAERAYEASAFAGANPNSLHTPGREAALALDGARHRLAKLVGGGFRPAELIFTSGGTESNNLAIFGLSRSARMKDVKRTTICLSAIEHESVLACAPELRHLGFDVKLLPVTREGVVDLDEARRLIDSSCALVSVMYANNETGAIQPVAELAQMAHAAGALMHTDAVQAFCRVPLDVSKVDAVSVTAHKVGGPVGTGALLVRGRLQLMPRAYGGGQESGRRSGTQDVRGALAFAAAAEAAADGLEAKRETVSCHARRLYELVCTEESRAIPCISSHVDSHALPGTVCLLCQGHDGNDLVLALDEAGYAVSSGSACAAFSSKPSHVLTAMWIAGPQALSALRVSFDERVPLEKLEAFAETLLGLLR